MISLLVAILTFFSATSDAVVCEARQLDAYMALTALDQIGPEQFYRDWTDRDFRQELQKGIFIKSINQLHSHTEGGNSSGRQLVAWEASVVADKTGPFCVYRFRTDFGSFIVDEYLTLRGNTNRWLVSGLFYKIRDRQ